MLLHQQADVVDRARRLRAAHEVQVLPIPANPVKARPQARVRCKDGTALALRHPRPQDLAADILDLDGTGLVGQVGERRLHGDHPVEQVVLFVLEADVQDVGLPARRDVARHLESHRRLAGPLGTADEQELARPDAVADGLVEGREAERHGLVLGEVPARDALIEVDQHIQRRARDEAPGRGIVTPLGIGRTSCRTLRLGAHAVSRSPDMRRQRDRSRAAIVALGSRGITPRKCPPPP